MKKSIVFIGMPDMAVVALNKLISSGHNIVGVILPDKTNQSRHATLNIAEKCNIPVFEYDKTPNEPDFVEKIAALNADIGVICSFNHKLSPEFLKTTKMGYINCHPSLLPYYRGANPYFHIIKNMEETSAVTLHFADPHFDTGKIVMQSVFPVGKRETMGMLFSRTNFMVADMLDELLTIFEERGEIPSKEQPEGEYIKAPNVPGEVYINWAEDVRKTDAVIRAANPFYNALTSFRGGAIRIISGTFKLERHNRPFGEMTKVKKGFIKIAAGGGFYFPNIIQPGSWGIYDVKEFVENFNPHQGEVLK